METQMIQLILSNEIRSTKVKLKFERFLCRLEL